MGKIKKLQPVLDLADLSKGIPALTPAAGSMQAECAAVCLDQHGHPNEVGLHVQTNRRHSYSMRRPLVTSRMRRTYSDLDVAVEFGAYGVAILVLRELKGLTAIERSWKRTGFDYWLGTATRNQPPFQNKARLEVSGILEGSESDVKTRLKKKSQQSKPSDKTGLPAYAVVVEFSGPRAQVDQRP